jgi:hypothetical protein
MIRFRPKRPRETPPPLHVPRINSRVVLLADGARYTARLDDIEPGHLVVAAPDALMAPERPLLLEWRDQAGLWQLPCLVTETRERPFTVIALRPTGASECVSEAQVVAADGAGGVRVAARVTEAGHLPIGTRIPVTSLQLAGDRIAFWTIVPLAPGDHVELTARTPDGESLRMGLVAAQIHVANEGYLQRIDCDAENPYAPAVGRLVAHLLAAAAPAPTAA